MPRLGQKHTSECRQKMSESHADFCGTKNPFYGKTHSAETRKRISEARMGHGHQQSNITRGLISQAQSGSGNSFYGKKHSEETLQRIRVIVRQKWSEPAYVKHWQISHHFKPNKLEKTVQDIIVELGLPYRFVGDGQFSLGSKVPDFVNVNGQKKIIEVFGCYWHGCKSCHPEEFHSNDLDERTQLFKSFGYSTLFLWEHELLDPESVRSKIIAFDIGE